MYRANNLGKCQDQHFRGDGAIVNEKKIHEKAKKALLTHSVKYVFYLDFKTSLTALDSGSPNLKAKLSIGKLTKLIRLKIHSIPLNSNIAVEVDLSLCSSSVNPQIF